MVRIWTWLDQGVNALYVAIAASVGVLVLELIMKRIGRRKA